MFANRLIAAGFAIALLSGCTISANVIGKVGTENETFLGTSTGYPNGTGDLEMSSADGVQCTGQYWFSGASGNGVLQCSDGRAGNVEFTRLTPRSGYGFGTTSDGKPIRFVFGMSELEGQRYMGPQWGSLSTSPVTPKAKTASSGTGFFINAKGQILTNEHVVGGCARITARAIDGTTMPGTVVAADATNDLAVVATDRTGGAFADFGDAASYRQGEPVVTYGFPLSSVLTESGNLTTGSVSALAGIGNDSRFLQITAPVQPGNSGGPLANGKGQVIGIVSSKLNTLKVAKVTGDIPQNVNFAIKDMVVKSFLQGHNITYSEARKSQTLSTADIGDLLKGYVVFIRCET